MANRADITPELLRQLLRYEPETGKLFWRLRDKSMFTTTKRSAEWNANAWNKNNAHKEAFTCLDNYGYPVGTVFGVRMKAHRVIWAIVTGIHPTEVDHIDGNSGNNKWENLRDVTHRDNQCNLRMRSDNKSGTTGVLWSEGKKRWLARIHIRGKLISLGSYKTKDEAIFARLAGEREHGFHENHGLHRP